MQLIDSHVHLNFDCYDDELDEVAQRWREAGIVQLVHSCVKPSEFEQLQAIADRFPEVFISVGLHPLDADDWTAEMAAEIRDKARSDQRTVAIGETGLDFFKADNEPIQREAFGTQIAIARELDLPLIIHCRNAAAAARDMLREAEGTRAVMHCWSGTAEETQWFVDLGFYISFSGIVTFKNAKTVKESAAIVPSDRLLVETDCPFLAPVPYRGKRNEPARVAHVAEYLAELRGISVADLARQTTANARSLFRRLALYSDSR
ncbi:MAG: TatD family hydrolase [Cyanobacteria bacterium J06639_1]